MREHKADRPAESKEHDVTHLLQAWNRGDVGARDRVVELVFEELRQIAHQQFRGEFRSRTLQPTHLIGAAWERLARRREVNLRDRKHFFGVVAVEMRHVLCDHARQKLAAKRGGGVEAVPLDEIDDIAMKAYRELVELDDALKSLADVNPQQAEIVELHFFGGLTFDEIAKRLGISRIMGRRRWEAARLWLRELMRHPR
jgi:RNA polymerase sigma factor (TIGR02999 family)